MIVVCENPDMHIARRVVDKDGNLETHILLTLLMGETPQ